VEAPVAAEMPAAMVTTIQTVRYPSFMTVSIFSNGNGSGSSTGMRVPCGAVLCRAVLRHLRNLDFYSVYGGLRQAAVGCGERHHAAMGCGGLRQAAVGGGWLQLAAAGCNGLQCGLRQHTAIWTSRHLCFPGH